MTHEIAIAQLGTDVTELNACIWFQCLNSGLTVTGNIHGSLCGSELDFCRAHGDAAQCQNCQSNACERCCFRFNVCRDLQNTQLIVKTIDANSSAIWLEAQIQQRLCEQFPANVARCIGRYERFCYYIRKKGASIWLPAKISVYIRNFGIRSRHASVDSLTLSSSSSSQTTKKEFDIGFDEFASRIRDSLFEMALIYNVPSMEATRQLRIDWMDEDFLQKHNYFIVPSMQEGLYTYVFFDFGCNLKLCES